MALLRNDSKFLDGKKIASENFVLDNINTHNNEENPHGVTKSHVGLSNVSNVLQASKEEFDSHINSSLHVSLSDRENWNNKQGSITAGENITIFGNTISATNTTYDIADLLHDGLMSKEDKNKLVRSSNTLDYMQLEEGDYFNLKTLTSFMITKSEQHIPLVNTSTQGLMSGSDKNKLDGIDLEANNYVHPTNHPASIITQDANNRFVTDTEKSTWNSKQNALGFTPENAANKGKPNGYASLDAGGKVPAAELPSYVDDIVEGTTLTNLPTTGETGKIYVTINDNKTYRWSGTDYVEISASLALGTTSLTAYRGDLGNVAYTHSQSSGNPHNTTKAHVGLGNVDNTSDANKPISTATESALNNKADKSQVLTNVPANAKFTDTIYTHPSTHPASMITESSSQRFVSDSEKSTWNAKQNALTAGSNVTISNNTISAVNTTYGVATTSANGLMAATDKVKLNGIATGANNYTHPSSHPASIITQDANNRFVTDSEKATWNGKQNSLTAGWNITISGDTISSANTTYGVATSSVDGLISSADKTKLNGIEADAQVNPSIASQLEALTGTNNTNMMTPLRTKEAILESALVVVNHGTNSSMARPSGASVVYWIGTVEPTRATNNDLWVGG